MLTALVLVLAGKIVWLGALGVGAYLGLRYVRTQERRGKAAELGELQRQIRELQATVAGLRIDLGRVQEGQDSTARLLSDRPSKRE